jgi:hypothetical protein
MPYPKPFLSGVQYSTGPCSRRKQTITPSSCPPTTSENRRSRRLQIGLVGLSIRSRYVYLLSMTACQSLPLYVRNRPFRPPPYIHLTRVEPHPQGLASMQCGLTKLDCRVSSLTSRIYGNNSANPCESPGLIAHTSIQRTCTRVPSITC